MANEYNINESALDAVLAEVTGEIAEMLRKDEAALMKAVGDKPSTDDEPAESSEGSSGPSDAPPEESGPPVAEASAPGAEAAPPAAAPEMSGAPEMAAPDQGGDIAAAPTVEQLQAEYSQLDPEQLKMHYLACKSAIMAQMGSAPGAAPPAPPAAAPPMAPEASAPPALKGEMKSGKQLGDAEANGGEMSKGKSMKKSETDVEIEALKAQLAAQSAQLKKGEETMLQLAELVAKPLRKSIKGLSDLQFVPKDGAEKTSPVANLSKAEIMVKLREKARSNDGKLTKSDRDLINQYTVGAVDLSKIEHLLAEAK